MRKWFIALFFLAAPVWAQEGGTAYDALRVVGTQLNREAVNHIISVTGVDGNPQPSSWKVLIDDQKARGGVRELEVSRGRIISERTPLHAIVGSTQGATINTAHLNLDSSGAYSVASRTAEKVNTPFVSANYTLRTDEHGDPIWIITLENQAQRPVGTIYIGANLGTVTRTEGMFNGAGMDQVMNADEADHDADQSDDDDNPNDENFVKRKIKSMFRHARDDAKRTFYNVRRSFVDFFNRS